jgi:hypothetical protein
LIEYKPRAHTPNGDPDKNGRYAEPRPDAATRATWGEMRAQLAAQDRAVAELQKMDRRDAAAARAERAADGPGARTVTQRPGTDASYPQPGEATLSAAFEMRRLRTGESYAQAMDMLGHVLACYAAGGTPPPPRLWKREALDEIETLEKRRRAAAAALEAAQAAEATAMARHALAVARMTARAEMIDEADRTDIAGTINERKAATNEALAAAVLRGEMAPGPAARRATSRAAFYRAMDRLRAEQASR